MKKQFSLLTCREATRALISALEVLINFGADSLRTFDAIPTRADTVCRPGASNWDGRADGALETGRTPTRASCNCQPGFVTVVALRTETHDALDTKCPGKTHFLSRSSIIHRVRSTDGKVAGANFEREIGSSRAKKGAPTTLEHSGTGVGFPGPYSMQRCSSLWLQIRRTVVPGRAQAAAERRG